MVIYMLKKIIIGLFAGLVCGFFGSGGGMILVPAFVHILGLNEKQARATSIYAVLPMVCTSIIFYLQANYIDWNIRYKMCFGWSNSEA